MPPASTAGYIPFPAGCVTLRPGKPVAMNWRPASFLLQNNVSLAGRTGRSEYSDGDPDNDVGFFIISHTRFPAVLVECGFMSNQDEMEFLLSAEG